MGVPVNLDEVSLALEHIYRKSADDQVDSHRISALPPLRITTAEGRRAASLDTRGSERNGSSSRDKGKGREEGPRSAAPDSGHNTIENGDGERGKYGLGKKPEFDMSKAEELCGLEEGQSLVSWMTLIVQERNTDTQTDCQSSHWRRSERSKMN